MLTGTETLEGSVKKLTYQNAETGWTIAALDVEGRDLSIAIVGAMPGLSAGETIRVTGHYVQHEKYGQQLQVDSWSRTATLTLKGLEQFLTSGTIKGIGPATARKLLDAFGLDVLHVLEREPERLQEIEGIGVRKAEGIVKSFSEHRSVQTVTVYLGARGVTPALAAKIFKKYGTEAIAVLEVNPYRLVDEVSGIGFKTADKLAQQLGLPLLSPMRLRIGLKHILKEAASDGHVCLPERDLYAQALDLLGPEAGPHLPATLEALVGERNGGVVIDASGTERKVYLAGFYYAEAKAAERVAQLVRHPLETAPDADLPALVAAVEREEGLTLAPLQREAVQAVLRERLVVVTGGPGTGKTTTVKAMIAALKQQQLHPVLAAPTGRAAKRMTESTGVLAKTLHRLLEYGQTEDEGMGFKRGESHPLEGKVFIIDEASMIDLLLFYQLVRALPPDARLVLCGDIDQLPSVGAGRVLQDVIESGRVAVVRLQTIFRQAEESLIVRNAHRINQGLLPQMQRAGDFFFLEEGRPEELIQLVLDLAARRLPQFLQADPVEDIQVLVPMKRGPLGVDALNVHLQAALNPPLVHKSELRRGERVFRVCDKVMQIRNNYQKEVYNGDVGRVFDIDPEEGEVIVEYTDEGEPRRVTYTGSEVDELTLAYAVSVHKSQGSEYPCVILPLTLQHRVMLQRNLLYTGVTRAKRLVVLAGTQDALRVAVTKSVSVARHSQLAARIQATLDS